MIYISYKNFSEAVAQYIFAIIMGLFSIISMEIKYCNSIISIKYILGNNESYIIEYDELQQKVFEIEKCIDILENNFEECKVIS